MLVVLLEGRRCQSYHHPAYSRVYEHSSTKTAEGCLPQIQQKRPLSITAEGALYLMQRKAPYLTLQEGFLQLSQLNPFSTWHTRRLSQPDRKKALYLAQQNALTT